MRARLRPGTSLSPSLNINATSHGSMPNRSGSATRSSVVPMIATVGEALFTKEDSRWFKQSHLQAAHAFYERHGGKTIMIARFVPIVRSFAPLVAGASGMNYRQFQLYNVLGAVIWVMSLVYGGYLFGNVPIIRDNLGIVLIVGMAVGAVLAVGLI